MSIKNYKLPNNRVANSSLGHQHMITDRSLYPRANAESRNSTIIENAFENDPERKEKSSIKKRLIIY